MSFSTYSSGKPRFLATLAWTVVQKLCKIKLLLWHENKKNRSKIPPDSILETVRAIKIHNLSIRQVALEFNMNYRALNDCKKS